MTLREEVIKNSGLELDESLKSVIKDTGDFVKSTAKKVAFNLKNFVYSAFGYPEDEGIAFTKKTANGHEILYAGAKDSQTAFAIADLNPYTKKILISTKHIERLSQRFQRALHPDYLKRLTERCELFGYEVVLDKK